MQPRNLFGDKDWNDVRVAITRRTRRKFSRATSFDIEDAVSLAMVDLVDYWIQLASSIYPDDPQRTFNQACRRGEWMAATFLTQDWDKRDVPSEPLTTGISDTPGDGHAPVARKWSASPEDVVIRDMERERFHRFMAEQLDALGDWLEPYLAGVTQRQQAKREGVSQSAIARRWQSRMDRLVNAAHDAGLAGEMA